MKQHKFFSTLNIVRKLPAGATNVVVVMGSQTQLYPFEIINGIKKTENANVPLRLFVHSGVLKSLYSNVSRIHHVCLFEM